MARSSSQFLYINVLLWLSLLWLLEKCEVRIDGYVVLMMSLLLIVLCYTIDQRDR